MRSSPRFDRRCPSNPGSHRRFNRRCPLNLSRQARSLRLPPRRSSRSGSHSAGPTNVTLLSVANPEARRFYEIEAAENAWSVRELKRQLDSSLYERLALSRDKHEVRRLAREGQVVEKASDLIKDPVVLEFLGLEEKPAYTENDLETAIIDRLQQFLLELGKGFLFEARQKRFSFDGRHFFVDLVFYNRLLRCYVLIDLKRGELAHQDLGQMQMYVNYFDRHVRTDGELPTIGILLCDRKNEAVVELTLPEDANIYASKYQLYLPSREELADQVARVRREIGGMGSRRKQPADQGVAAVPQTPSEKPPEGVPK